MQTRSDERKRRVFRLAAMWAVVVAVALSGCQPKQEAPATESAPVTEALGSTQPISMTWDQQSSCINFNPPSITIKVGDKVRFNSSIAQTVTLRISASAFGTADTTMTVSAQGSYTTGAAVTPGSYEIAPTPAMCPGLGGGVGPTIIIEETK